MASMSNDFNPRSLSFLGEIASLAIFALLALFHTAEKSVAPSLREDHLRDDRL